MGEKDIRYIGTKIGIISEYMNYVHQLFTKTGLK